MAAQGSALSRDYENVAEIGNKYNFLKQTFVGWKSETMPLSVRKLIQTQLAADAVTPSAKLGINENQRLKAFWATTGGFAFTLATRIVRIALFTIFLLPAILVRLGTAVYYGMPVGDTLIELLKNYGEELADGGITIACLGLGVAKTIYPKAFTDATRALATYYLQRADRRRDFATDEATDKAGHTQDVQDAKTRRQGYDPVARELKRYVQPHRQPVEAP